MRTIETTLYEFEELSGQAQQVAINNLRQRAFADAADNDWADANQTIKQVKQIAHVQADIEYSSQGYYARWYKNTNEQYDLTDAEEFEQFKQDFAREFRNCTWSDDIMQDLIDNAEFDDKRSYAGNIS